MRIFSPPLVRATQTILGDGTGGQWKGTNTNDAAAAGNIGEKFFTSLLSGAAVALTSGATKSIMFLDVTAGDWDIWGQVDFLPDAATTYDQIIAAVSLVNNGLPNPDVGARQVFSLNFLTGGGTSIAAPPFPYSFAVTTRVYLSANADFFINTMSAYGNLIARRRR